MGPRPAPALSGHGGAGLPHSACVRLSSALQNGCHPSPLDFCQACAQQGMIFYPIMVLKTVLVFPGRTAFQSVASLPLACKAMEGQRASMFRQDGTACQHQGLALGSCPLTTHSGLSVPVSESSSCASSYSPSNSPGPPWISRAL